MSKISTKYSVKQENYLFSEVPDIFELEKSV